ncbi:MAG TPA: sigma-70 family RNA polymerase sigma factor [Bryobacteraceae bacterium]|nr:sigma-70 family RNA polymerase sigma factor [Bryobacteraceae bacterium]
MASPGLVPFPLVEEVSTSQFSYEHDLLCRLASGDAEAFWPLWEHHKAPLFRICYIHMGRRREDAEDALSEVRDRARESLLREGDKVRSLTAWLRRVAVNVCLDMHRSRERRSSIPTSPGEKGRDFVDRTLQFPEPASQFLAREALNVITRAIDALPLRLRTAARLFFLEEKPYDGIAKQLFISEPNARKRIQEARGILRDMLKVEFPERREPGTAVVTKLAGDIRLSPKVSAQRKQLSAAFGAVIES